MRCDQAAGLRAGGAQSNNQSRPLRWPLPFFILRLIAVAKLRDRTALSDFDAPRRAGEPDGFASGAISVTPCQVPLSTSSRTSDLSVSATASVAGLRRPTSEKQSETGRTILASAKRR